MRGRFVVTGTPIEHGGVRIRGAGQAHKRFQKISSALNWKNFALRMQRQGLRRLGSGVRTIEFLGIYDSFTVSAGNAC